MNRRFSPEVKKVISQSRDEAIRLGHDFIGTEHLLLGIIRDKQSLALKVLQSLDVNTKALKDTIEDSVKRGFSPKASLNVGNLPLDKQAEKVLKVTFLEAKNLRNDEICPEHLILSILKNDENLACTVLNQFDVNYEIYKSELEYVRQDLDFNGPGTVSYTHLTLPTILLV